jgi:hypothetical protein
MYTSAPSCTHARVCVCVCVCVGGGAGVHMLVPFQSLNQIHNFHEILYKRYAIGLICNHFPRMDLTFF